jgi:hypothetical protein
MRAVATHPAMQFLDLGYMDTIGYEGLRLIGPELAHAPAGFELNVSACVGLAEWQPHSALAMAAGQALAAGMKANPGLRFLEYDTDKFTDEISDPIILYIYANEFGRQFFVAPNYVDENRDEEQQHQYGLAPAVYCHVLANCNRRNLGRDWYPSVMYTLLLREGPSLVLQQQQLPLANPSSSQSQQHDNDTMTRKRRRADDDDENDHGNEATLDSELAVGAEMPAGHDMGNETLDHVDESDKEEALDDDDDDESSTESDDEETLDDDDDDYESSSTESDDEEGIKEGRRYWYPTRLNDKNAAKFQHHLTTDANYPRSFAFGMEHSLTAVGANILAAAIRQLQFQQLVVAEDEPPPDAAAAMIVLEAIQQIQTMKHLVLAEFNMDHLGCVGDMLADVQGLEKCVIDFCGVWTTTAIQSLASGLGSTSSLKVLSMTKSLLGVEHMRMLAVGLRNNSSVITLNLRFSGIQDEGIKAFLENWPNESPIKMLFLGHNNIGPEGAQLLVKAAVNHPALILLGLQGQKQLIGCPEFDLFREKPSSFQFSSVKISKYSFRYFRNDDDDDADRRAEEDGPDIANIVIKARVEGKRISFYHTFEILTDPIYEAGDILESTPSTIKLELNYCEDWGQSLYSLSDSVGRSHVLKELNLCGTKLGDHGMTALSVGLGTNISLETLRLSDNEIGDEGLAAFADNWHADSQIKALYLCENLIEPRGAQLLFRAIANHVKVQELSLRSNKRIGYAGLKLIGDELANTRLQNLDISYIADTYSDEVDSPNYHKAGRALVEGIRQNFHLRDFEIDGPGSFYVQFDEDEDDEVYGYVIDFYVALNNWGRHLLSEDHGFPSTAWCHVFAKALQDSELEDSHYETSLIYYFLREQPDLVQFARIV